MCVRGVIHFFVFAALFFLASFLSLVSSLARLVGRSRVRQRKCDAKCAQLEAFQTHWTLSFAVHTPPVRPSAVRLQPLAM